MKLQHFKLILVSLGLIGLLLITVPALSCVWPSQPGEVYSDLYLLGPQHEMGNYPFNVVINQNYTVFIGVSNYLASSAYYLVYVKFGDLTQLPNDTVGVANGSPSPLLPLFESRQLIQKGSYCQIPLIFSIQNATSTPTESTVSELQINGIDCSVNASVMLNSDHKNFDNQPLPGFYYELIVELWIYNSRSQSFAYDNNYVNLPLNLTV